MGPMRIQRLLYPSLLAMLLLYSGWAQGAIQVNTVELYREDAQIGLQVVADSELDYHLSSLQDPARVIVELPNANLSPQALDAPTATGFVQELRIDPGKKGSPPRLELRLEHPVSAQAVRRGATLNIVLSPQEAEGQTADTDTADGSVITLQDYRLIARTAGKVTLHLKTSAPIARLRSFRIGDPPRLVVDLYGVKNALAQSLYTLDQPWIERLRFGEHKDRLRAVVDLQRQSIRHSVESTPEGVNINLQNSPGGQSRPTVTGVDFTVGPEEDTGRIKLELDRPGAAVQLHRETGKVIMDLPHGRLDPELEKRLVVTDFGTAVETIDLYQRDSAVRVVASGSGPLRPTAYQVDSRVILDVAQKETAPSNAQARPGTPYEGEPLSLNFQDIAVRQALKILAEFAELNIIASEEVGGNLTMRLQNVPWDQALDLILDTQGLGMVRQGNVIRVAPQAVLRQQRKAKLKAQLSRQQLVPLETKLIQVNYAKASELKQLLMSQANKQGGLLSSRGSISVDTRTNTLLVREIPEQLQRIEALVEKLDRPIKQVMIKARIVKVDTNFERNLGVRWGGQFQTKTAKEFPHTIQLSGDLSGAQTGASALAVDLPAAGAGLGNPSTLGLRLGEVANDLTLDLELSAIEAEGNGKIISSPRVITGNQQEAIIEQGEEIPFQSQTSSGATDVSFKKAVLSLNVTPQITPDGRIIMDVNASNDTRGQDTVAGPAINTEEVTTQVLVDDGETVVIGGIFDRSRRKDQAGIPFLRSIPVLGWLFRTTNFTTQKTELLIFLTPRILEQTRSKFEGMDSE